jgi:hypothetical protein
MNSPSLTPVDSFPLACPDLRPLIKCFAAPISDRIPKRANPGERERYVIGSPERALFHAIESGDAGDIFSILASDGGRLMRSSIRHAAAAGDSAMLLALLALPGGADAAGAPLAEASATEMWVKDLIGGEAPKSDGHTALMLAAGSGSRDAVDALLPVSNPKAADATGATALIWAAEFGGFAVVERLLPASDRLAVDDRGQSALMHAALSGCVEAVELLAPASDAWAVDDNGRTAFMRAAESGSVEAVAILGRVSDIHAVDDNGWNALMWATHGVLGDWVGRAGRWG